jgi:serine/threonine protein phosphatase PrpC
MLRDRVITWDTASRQGGRRVNADAAGASRDMSGHVVFALADGIGDDMWAAEAARVASDVAARTSSLAGPVEAILAAQRAVESLRTGADCVLVVAMSGLDGHRIAWVGDVRAYQWDGDAFTQITTDQTMAEYFRAHDELPTPRMEHMVTNSVRRTSPEQIGQAEVRPGGSLLLSSDGLHKTVSPQTIQAVLAEPGGTPHDRVATLVDTAMLLGGHDNATALVISS